MKANTGGTITAPETTTEPIAETPELTARAAKLTETNPIAGTIVGLKTGTHTVSAIEKVLAKAKISATHHDILEVLRRLTAAKVGVYTEGRRGHPSRFEFGAVNKVAATNGAKRRGRPTGSRNKKTVARTVQPLIPATAGIETVIIATPTRVLRLTPEEAALVGKAITAIAA